METRRPQLPSSGEVLGFVLGAVRLRAPMAMRVPERTLRRVLDDEPGVKPETRREVLEAALAELFPDDLLTAWGMASPGNVQSEAGGLRARFVELVEAWLSRWDAACGALRSTGPDVPDWRFALLPWVRMFAVEMGVRVGAYLVFTGAPDPEEEDTRALVDGRAFDRLVRRYRQASGALPREDLAKGSGVSESTVDEWLAGRSLPQAESILSLAAVIAARVPGAVEAVVVFHLRCAVAAADVVRALHAICPIDDPQAAFGPGRAAQFVIEFLAILEMAHVMLRDLRAPRRVRRRVAWAATVHGSQSPGGKLVLDFACTQARDSYIRADVLGALNERWQERVLMLYRQLPTLEGARRDPFAKEFPESILPELVEMEAWGRVSPNPGGWLVPPLESEMKIPEGMVTLTLNQNDMLPLKGRLAKRALEAQHAKGDEVETLAYHQRLVEMEPDNALYHFWLGCSLAAVGKADEGVVECRIAKGLEPEWSLPAVEVAIILANVGRTSEALATMRAMDGSYEVDAHFANMYGYALMCEGHLDEAIAWFRRTLKLNPDHARATMHLAHCVLMKGDRPEGRRLAKLARHRGEPAVFEALKAGKYDGQCKPGARGRPNR